MLPIALVDNVGKSALRLIAVLAVVVLGFGIVAVSIAWAAPFALTLVAILIWTGFLLRRVRTRARRDKSRGDLADRSGTGTIALEFWRFAAPRAFTAVFATLVRYLDTILVGNMRGTHDAGIYAVYLVCTHLGCTPNYVTDVVTGSGVDPAVAEARGVRTAEQRSPNGWACPCHGSRYFIDSTNFYGPAPRPMDWVNIQVTPDGFFAVDRAALVATRGPGNNAAPQWRLLVDTKKSNGKTLGV